MVNIYFRILLSYCCLAGLLFSHQLVSAQTSPPAWQAALEANGYLTGNLYSSTLATDQLGNVYVAGSFYGQVVLGATTLVSKGGAEAFVAKWSATTNNFVWALSAGGTGQDGIQALAVSGNTLYVTGSLANNASNDNNVTVGTTAVLGTTGIVSNDVFVAKITDAGTSASFGWSIVAGGRGDDQAGALAVNGNSVYVAGIVTNDAANNNTVLFGAAPLVGLAATATNDVFVAKLTDAGATASFTWARAAGGRGSDVATALTLNGGSLYVAGRFVNNAADVNAVSFGAVALPGASATTSPDAFVAKLTDVGTTGNFVWAQAAGGSYYDQALALVANGSNLYLAGSFVNTAANGYGVTFGAAGTLVGTTTNPAGTTDIFISKLTDTGSSGSFVWAQAAGGSDSDAATGLAISGNNLYVTGYYNNNSANANTVTFGNLGAIAGVSSVKGPDIFVSRLTDVGTTANWTWLQRAGGPAYESGNALAVVGTSIYTTGNISGDATFTGATGSPLRSGSPNSYVGRLVETGTSATWMQVSQAGTGGSATAKAVATDASGNVLVTGSFTGRITLGATTLISTGADDIFVAKFNPVSNNWLWAQQAGGLGSDVAYAVAVSGNAIYVAGLFRNSTANDNLVVFGSNTLNGQAAQLTTNAYVAKLTDAGSSVSWTWAVAAGGKRYEQVSALAVNDGSVYLAGVFVNDAANTNNVYFGTTPLSGKSTFAASEDAFIAKLTDAGSSASFVWALAAGGTNQDVATGLAVNGNAVYMSGLVVNSSGNASNVTFGSLVSNGISQSGSADGFLAKLTDAGATASFTWVQLAGGDSGELANAVAVNGNSVYLAGYVTNTSSNSKAVTVGGIPLNGMSAILSSDAFVAKFTDGGSAGTAVWARAAGGAYSDEALGIAVNGGGVYLTGYFTNSSANGSSVTFGPTSLAGTDANMGQDGFLTRLVDAGSTATFAWAKATGGSGDDRNSAVAINGAKVAVAGTLAGTAFFDNSFLLSDPYGNQVAYVAALTDTSSPLPTIATAPQAALALYPNPMSEQATLTGLLAKEGWVVYDSMGHSVATGIADKAGTAQLRLTASVTAGVYILRANGRSVRFVVQ